ncbi:PTS transporter subunit IIC [Tetragenococcus koreensis]|uniref:PTS transporter subunit IIC n=1 Tax=Tetragenococcus koreensis TaxID=290335 RepID=UPI000F4F09A8|nr:PTS transporter subunit IIC [Tetragenococcus koreensis]AYW44730.1 PTS galactitol transporter subunit IIC [Tetragenococcus koreensis]GEN92025.1 PTS glucitol transporter subunit IIA [Tetragenococcus koreensis]
MINALENGFNFFIGLGGPAIMFVVLTLLGVIFRAPLSKSIEGGLRMAIALTGMSAVISLLTEAFGPALNNFVASTGIELSITDLGWAPLALITWGSIYTLYFAFICFVLNIILLFMKATETLNVDLFNIWNVSILGLLLNYYAHNIVVTSVFVLFIYSMMLLNADAMKPTLDKVLDYDENNITTTAHPSFLIAPLAMLINRFIDICLPFIDRFDFDAETLNRKIGFWGSKFAIGAYLGVFIGLLGQQSTAAIFELAFTGGVALELFSIVGSWFGPAIEPLSDGVQNAMSKRLRGRRLLIAIDWPIVASRAEVWAVVNLLAPILLIIAMILPGNKVMPLGGILMTILTPALLIVTQGKVIRMTLIGTILIPIYLWSATMVAKFITSASIAMDNFPAGLEQGQTFTSVDSNPLEKMIAIVLGEGVHQFDITKLAIAGLGIVVYVLLFVWYKKQLKVRLNK